MIREGKPEGRRFVRMNPYLASTQPCRGLVSRGWPGCDPWEQQGPPWREPEAGERCRWHVSRVAGGVSGGEAERRRLEASERAAARTRSE